MCWLVRSCLRRCHDCPFWVCGCDMPSHWIEAVGFLVFTARPQMRDDEDDKFEKAGKLSRD